MIPVLVRGTLASGAATPGLDVFNEFRPFTWMHALTAGLMLGLSLAASLLGRRWRGTDRELTLGAFLGGMILARQGVEVIWYFLPPNFSWERSLPLQFCDIAPWIAAIALLTERRWARTLLYYWGIGLSTQAFFTPTVDQGIAHTRFWWFWLGHTHIVGSAIYDMVARGYRPGWKDLRLAIAVTTCYTLSMIALDVATGFNYGYVGPSKPQAPTIIDALGPYPWRIAAMMGIVAAAFVAITWVWRPGRAGAAARPH